jgi:flagellar biosynthesis protein FlhA
LELGVGLIRLADPKRGGDLLERIQRVRQSVAAEIGLILPKVRIRDNLRLDQQQYRIKIADVVVTHGTIHEKMSEPTGVIATHLTETVRRHADELLTRDAVKHLIDQLRHTSPAVIDELIPAVMKLGEVQQVLRLLLREAVPIRQLGPILEALGDYAPRSKDEILLAEYVRQRMARSICTRYRDQDGRLHVVTLDPTLEERIRAGFQHDENGLRIHLSPQAVEEVCDLIAPEVDKLVALGRPPIVLVGPDIRPALRQMTAAHVPQLIVLSYNEITRDTRIESLALVSAADNGQLSAVGHHESE